MQEEHQHLPNMDRISVLVASVLLAYALLPFIKIPERVLDLPVLGVMFSFKVDFSTLISLISGGLAAAGADWLVREHPHLGKQATFPHWLIPALTAWVLGAPLNSLVVGLQWWAVFIFGGLLLLLVLVAEYIAVDPYDTRYGLAAVALTAISSAIFLILTITLAGAGARLYLMLPSLGAALFLITLRNLYLRLSGRWCVGWTVGIVLVVGQVVTALHYWPLHPLRFGLLVLGLVYALTSLAGSLEENRPWNRLWIEPVVMLLVLWGLAFFLQA